MDEAISIIFSELYRTRIPSLEFLKLAREGGIEPPTFGLEDRSL